MDESQSSTAVPATRRMTLMSFITWIAVSSVGVTALALLAAHCPSRIRLIGLFSIAFGLGAGWVITQAARILELHPPLRAMEVMSALLTLAGLIGCTIEIFRLDELRHPEFANERLARQMIAQMNSAASENISVPAAPSVLTRFQQHLAQLIRQLGQWQSPWPEIFWTSELIAAACASVCMVRYRLIPATERSTAPPQTIS